MMICDRSVQTQRYHDRELSAPEAAEAEAHLAECPACRELLDDLRRLSRTLTQARTSNMPAGLIARLVKRHPQFEERAVLRLAGWMTAMAACIMIATLLSWPADRADASAPAVWQSVAVTPLAEMNDGPGGEMVVLAQWMADELATSRNGELR